MRNAPWFLFAILVFASGCKDEADSSVIVRDGSFAPTTGPSAVWWNRRPVLDGQRFSQGLACVQVRDFRQVKQWGYIDTQGRFAIVPQYDLCQPFREGLAAVLIGRRWGFVDRKGRRVIEPRFETVSHFVQARAWFHKAGRPPGGDGSRMPMWGFVDKKGRVVVKPRYVYYQDFSEGLAGVVEAATFATKGQASASWGYVDRTGKMVIPPQFDEVGPFSEGLAAVFQAATLYYINRKGEKVLKVKYRPRTTSRSGARGISVQRRWTLPTPFSEGRSVVGDEDRFVLINRQGKRVVKKRFDALLSFSSGRAAFREGVILKGQRNRQNRWGFIDRSGMVVIPPRYFAVTGFSNGLAAVSETRGVWGYIDGSGKWVIPPRFAKAMPFSEGLAFVRLKNGTHAYVDRKGNLIRQ